MTKISIIILIILVLIFSFTEFLVFNEEVLLLACFGIFFTVFVSTVDMGETLDSRSDKISSDVISAFNETASVSKLHLDEVKRAFVLASNVTYAFIEARSYLTAQQAEISSYATALISNSISDALQAELFAERSKIDIIQQDLALGLFSSVVFLSKFQVLANQFGGSAYAKLLSAGFSKTYLDGQFSVFLDSSENVLSFSSSVRQNLVRDASIQAKNAGLMVSITPDLVFVL